MRVLLAILVLLFARAAGSEEADSAAGSIDPARESIASCVSNATGEEVGLAELEETCPGIGDALDRAGYADFISEDESGQLTSYGLQDLLEISERYRTPPADRSPEADVTRLAPILASLEEARRADQELTWTERFKRWLNNMVRRSQQQEDSWLSRWLRDVDVSEGVVSAIVYAAVALILLIAVAVIVNELRAAGVFRRRERRAAATAAGIERPSSASEVGLADLDRVPPEARPAVLLRVLVNTLLKTGRLQLDKSLTHRELGARARFDALDQRQSFNLVAALSERVLYGNRKIPAEEIDAVMAVGRMLDRQLNVPRAAT